MTNTELIESLLANPTGRTKASAGVRAEVLRLSDLLSKLDGTRKSIEIRECREGYELIVECIKNHQRMQGRWIVSRVADDSWRGGDLLMYELSEMVERANRTQPE